MSFILDALKKSESDRQRQSGPALYEVKVAPPRGGLPPWAVAVVILLAINLMIGLWMLLRHPVARTASEAGGRRAGGCAGPHPGRWRRHCRRYHCQPPGGAHAAVQTAPAGAGAAGTEGGHADS